MFVLLVYGGCGVFVHRWWESRFCGAIWTNPPWALVSGLAAVPALVLLWEWRTVQRGSELREQERANNHAQAEFDEARDRSRHEQENTVLQYSLAQSQQLSGRFADAVRLLADERPDSRLGGIYALERLAHDSEATYKGMVVRTLSAFIRHHAQKPHPREQPDWDELDFGPDGPSIDVQTAATVLAELGPTDAAYADLSDARLCRLSARKARLRGANLEHTDLWSARLDQADLEDSQAAGVTLDKATLVGANLRAAVLRNAHLQEASLEGADLTGAVVQGAQLLGANLSGTKLRCANLRETRIQGANFENADLRDADLSSVEGEARWRRARYNSATRFPEGFNPKYWEMDSDENGAS
jgi:uncharacterized protein YjbI with pentapeptide repeats